MRSLVAATLLAALLVASVLIGSGPGRAAGISPSVRLSPEKVGHAVMFDRTPPLSEMRLIRPSGGPPPNVGERGDGPPADRGHKRDRALQAAQAESAIPAPLFTFEGPSNADNFRIFGFRVNPPDPNGDVGQHHYVAMVNLTFAIYSKEGALLFGPAAIGTLWQGFPIEDCTDPSGDPIVLYDEISNRWILTQFTTRGLKPPPEPREELFICVAVSETQDPLGPYFRYAFSTDLNFPDYPKYGIMPNGFFITTREFGPPPDEPESIGIYAINRHKLIGGEPSPEIVVFHLTEPPNLVGDGLLPADFDGKRMPPPHSPEYFVGSMDDDAFDGAPFDALNVFHLNVNWARPEAATFELIKQVLIAEYDTIFPCGPVSARDCLPQPGIMDRTRFLDILSYRQRPIWRLQYRNFGTHESLVTNQSVEARPGIAGIRWWELRNPRDPILYQEGTWAPDDGVHRWMGSVALDKQGNMAVGYSVVNGTDVFPGIRYAGRLAGDPLGQLSQGEAVLQAGSGVQTTTNSRWGDYTSMNVDPRDDCTFWYINEYYARSGTAADGRPWQTRIGVFKFPSCK